MLIERIWIHFGQQCEQPVYFMPSQRLSTESAVTLVHGFDRQPKTFGAKGKSRFFASSMAELIQLQNILGYEVITD